MSTGLHHRNGDSHTYKFAWIPYNKIEWVQMFQKFCTERKTLDDDEHEWEWKSEHETR